jgi:hypothetical protein
MITHCRLGELLRAAKVLLRRRRLLNPNVHAVSAATALGNYELIDERGDRLGMIRTSPTVPTFGNGAPTYLLTRLQHRAHELCTRFCSRTSSNTSK